MRSNVVPADRRRRWPRHAAYGLAGLAVLVPTGTAGAGWYFATRVIDATAPREYPLEVRALDGDRVTLTRDDESARDVPLALVWPDGHAILGAVHSVGKGTVVRQLVEVTSGRLRVGLRAYVSGAVFGGDPRMARGLDFADVQIPGELGPLPSWLVPGSSSTWVVAVHGRRATRTEALRVLPTIAAAGLPTLVVSYRNDEGAPPSPDRYYHLGATEWRDVAAAVTYAIEHGATDVVLYGWSMGGATVLSALRHLDPGVVRGVVLDCPVIDWVPTLYMNARHLGLPVPLSWAALRWIERRLRVRLSSLDHRRDILSLDVPVLLYVDADDRAVDPGPAREYAQIRPDLVHLVETTGAGHTRSWNADPETYEQELSSFLARVLVDARETR
jgi:pimeloyl-ACP methyl ester carboxylesterase